MQYAPSHDLISHTRAKKDLPMLILLALAAAWAGFAAGRAAWNSIRALPRDNEDMVFY